MQTKAGAASLADFRKKIEDILKHPVITDNNYTLWLCGGSANTAQIRDNCGQFGVFSNFFRESQVKRVVRARTEESREEALVILLNEFGIPFGKDGGIEGRAFNTKHMHFEWLKDIARALELEMPTFGCWETGNDYTRKFIKELDDVYGSFDAWISEGASFGIENWAAHGIGGHAAVESKNFWRQHIEGYKAYNRKHRLAQGLSPLKLKFFIFHYGLELKHKGSVDRELEKNFLNPDFDGKKFLEGMEWALDAIHLLWKGLDKSRKTLA